MENEIMNDAMVSDVEICEATPGVSGKNIGMALLIGAGATAATIAAVKLGKKVYAKIKEKRELQEVDEDYADA